ncbi:hypothetical protein GZH53_01655 [Flavihumibacter sp. R14]|nr:hypothetical protein [Flavihumibacter soli]
MKTNNSFFIIAFIALMATISNANAQSPLKATYKLDRVSYRVADEDMRLVLESEKANTEFKSGQIFDKQTFEKERERIAKVIKERVDPGFDKKQIRFLVDTTQVKNLFSIETVIARK